MNFKYALGLALISTASVAGMKNGMILNQQMDFQSAEAYTKNGGILYFVGPDSDTGSIKHVTTLFAGPISIREVPPSEFCSPTRPRPFEIKIQKLDRPLPRELGNYAKAASWALLDRESPENKFNHARVRVSTRAAAETIKAKLEAGNNLIINGGYMGDKDPWSCDVEQLELSEIKSSGVIQ